MNLPETLIIQCNCGTIIKLEASVVTVKEEIDNAIKQRQSESDFQEMVREQLCTCGHMAFIHSKISKGRPCLKSGCDCVQFKSSYWLAPAIPKI